MSIQKLSEHIKSMRLLKGCKCEYHWSYFYVKIAQIKTQSETSIEMYDKKFNLIMREYFTDIRIDTELRIGTLESMLHKVKPSVQVYGAIIKTDKPIDLYQTLTRYYHPNGR